MLDDYLPNGGFKNLLANLSGLMGGSPHSFPAYDGPLVLISLFLDGIVYPAGHLSNFSRKMAELVKQSGGDFVTSCGAEEVLFKGQGAKTLPIGVRLSDGSQVRSNVVILNVDPRRALTGLICPSFVG